MLRFVFVGLVDSCLWYFFFYVVSCGIGVWLIDLCDCDEFVLVWEFFGDWVDLWWKDVDLG